MEENQLGIQISRSNGKSSKTPLSQTQVTKKPKLTAPLRKSGNVFSRTFEQSIV
ncbi:predicted protein [Botrytis cinerea T4]|uniref:Uncharacterized protein n=1 Tax=Botryotinia fuckeliana (strain T4) TaxID=999810 RepID=G2YU43_BOTF4|nr:predicted protein [Botrytis cinerea T4]